jgi:hypothetical protein
MSLASPAYIEIIDFIAGGTTPETVANFQPSREAQQRVATLLELQQDGALSADERANWIALWIWSTS